MSILDKFKRRKPQDIVGHCMRCGTQRHMANVVDAVLKNGTPALRGECVNCGTKMTRFVKR